MMTFILSKYSGWYSVSDEAFYNEDEIIDKRWRIKLAEAFLDHRLSGLRKSLIFLDYLNGKTNLLDYYEKNQRFYLTKTEKK